MQEIQLCRQTRARRPWILSTAGGLVSEAYFGEAERYNHRWKVSVLDMNFKAFPCSGSHQAGLMGNPASYGAVQSASVTYPARPYEATINSMVLSDGVLREQRNTIPHPPTHAHTWPGNTNEYEHAPVPATGVPFHFDYDGMIAPGVSRPAEAVPDGDGDFDSMQSTSYTSESTLPPSYLSDYGET